MPIYLDNNATTPVDPRVLETMLPWFSEKFGNAASSTHSFGWEAETAVKLARQKIADAIGALPEEIIFTSGSTEAINLAIKGVAELYGRKGNHFITVKTEHKAVLDVFGYLEKAGKQVTYLEVDNQGNINLDELKSAISDQTVLAAIMVANNETGTIHPYEEISAILKERGVIFMSDATQAIGKINLRVEDSGIDLMCLSAHKFYGPKGVGALYKRRRGPRVALAAQIHGGGHEKGFRSGTLNVPGIVGMGKAIGLAYEESENFAQHTGELRDQLESKILEIDGTQVNGNIQSRLSNTSNISFADLDGDMLIKALREIAVSHGSACTSAVPEPSHVLSAMGIEEDLSYASIRFSLGRFSTKDEIEKSVEIVRKAVDHLRLT